MNPGDMLAVLERAERALTRWKPPTLLDDVEGWNTLDVNYEPPRVERLWRPFEGSYRLYLHRIHPCDTALFHPHPWPSAVKILSGAYEMAFGYGVGENRPPIASTLILHQGSSYEMVNPDAWHSVRPLRTDRHPSGLSYSLMVTGPVWDRWAPRAPVQLGPLSQEAKTSILAAIGSFYGR